MIEKKRNLFLMGSVIRPIMLCVNFSLQVSWFSYSLHLPPFPFLSKISLDLLHFPSIFIQSLQKMSYDSTRSGNSNSNTNSKRSFNSISSNNNVKSGNKRKKNSNQKTLGASWGANSSSSSRSSFRTAPFSDFGRYYLIFVNFLCCSNCSQLCGWNDANYLVSLILKLLDFRIRYVLLLFISVCTMIVLRFIVHCIHCTSVLRGLLSILKNLLSGTRIFPGNYTAQTWSFVSLATNGRCEE